MGKRLWTLLAAGTLACGALTVACSDDDTNASSNPGSDGGGPTSDGATAGDAGCTFAGYVTGLIDTQTNATALPATDLGDSCTPSTNQADFQPLFQ